MTVTFMVTGTGATALDIYYSVPLDSIGVQIAHTVEDGYFYTTWPVADFEYSPDPFDYPGHPIQGETIAFDASASYDPDGGVITLYEWDFGDETSDTGQSVTHAYDTAGSYLVTLTVTDDEAETYERSREVVVFLHDISVTEIIVDPLEVVAGNPVTIDVTVSNIGSTLETFNVTVYFDDTPIDTQTYQNLLVTDSALLTFVWNTEVAAGDYPIKAYAYLVDLYTLEPLPDLETNMEDNTLIGGPVTVTVPVENHDVAVVSVVPSPTTVTVGNNVNIDVEVTNEGDFTETFDVTVYFNDTPVSSPQTVTNLESGASTSLNFIWDTTGVSEDTYVISAYAAIVDGETDTADNTLTDGEVTVVAEYDTTPPTITINSPTEMDYLHSDTLTLDFSAVDLESGIASVTATLDGVPYENGESIELYTLSLGQHTFMVTATDNADNTATETVVFNVIATVDSLIDLVEKFYDLGWINDADFKDGLLAKLYAANAKIEMAQIREAKKDLKAAKNILNAFMNQVEADAHVTAEAISILSEDVQYVQAQL